MREAVLEIDRRYTKTPDLYFDSIMRTLSDGEWKILSVIIRKTVGFRKYSDKISISQFMGMTGYTQRKSILRIRESLAKKGLISYDQSAGGKKDNCTRYTIILPEGVSLKPETQRTGESEMTDTGVLNAPTRVSQTTPTTDSSYNKQNTTKTDNPLNEVYGMSPNIHRALENFRLSVFDFGHINRLLTPINQAVALVGEEIVEKAIASAAIAGKNPSQDRDKLPKNITGLLKAPDRLRMWADRHRKPDIVAEYEALEMSPEGMAAFESMLQGIA